MSDQIKIGTKDGEICNRPMQVAVFMGGAVTILCNMPMRKSSKGKVFCGNNWNHARYERELNP